MAKTTSKIKKVYNCTQSQLYAICMLIWASCKREIASFSALKGIYTLPYIAEKVTKVLEANNIPNEEDRLAVAEEIRINLKKKVDAKQDISID